eukprot:6482158-Amphidinium_carterae.1
MDLFQNQSLLVVYYVLRVALMRTVEKAFIPGRVPIYRPNSGSIAHTVCAMFRRGCTKGELNYNKLAVTFTGFECLQSEYVVNAAEWTASDLCLVGHAYSSTLMPAKASAELFKELYQSLPDFAFLHLSAGR